MTTTEVQDFEYWTNKLNENKAKYKANEIPKDEYQKNGRRIRAKRRKSVAIKPEVVEDSGATVTNTPPGPKKRKSRKRKKAKIVRTIGFGEQNVFYRKLTEAIDVLPTQTDGISKPRKALPEAMHQAPFQAIPVTEIMKLELAEPKDYVVELINRFKSKWLMYPTHYSNMRQGDTVFFCLGPVDKTLMEVVDHDGEPVEIVG